MRCAISAWGLYTWFELGNLMQVSLLKIISLAYSIPFTFFFDIRSAPRISVEFSLSYLPFASSPPGSGFLYGISERCWLKGKAVYPFSMWWLFAAYGMTALSRCILCAVQLGAHSHHSFITEHKEFPWCIFVLIFSVSLSYHTVLLYIKYQKKSIYLTEAQYIWCIIDTNGFPFYHLSLKHLPSHPHAVYRVLRR